MRDFSHYGFYWTASLGPSGEWHHTERTHIVTAPGINDHKYRIILTKALNWLLDLTGIISAYVSSNDSKVFAATPSISRDACTKCGNVLPVREIIIPVGIRAANHIRKLFYIKQFGLDFVSHALEVN